MNNSQASSARSSNSARHPRPRPVTKPVALPRTRPEALELRDLLEANLHALHALHDEHRRLLELGLRTVEPDLHNELRALGSPRAPWVKALSDSRALLFVALRELIIGANEAELTMRMQADDIAELRYRTR